MTINDFISWSILHLDKSRKDVTFYDYAKCMLNEWRTKLTQVNIPELLTCINKETVKPIKQAAFYNLINYIIEKYLEILKYAYQGNLFDAINLLRKLLYKQKYTQNKLQDNYINYFSFKCIAPQNTFYRIVDFCNDEQPKNCNHIPFKIRQLAKHNRFNIFGYPCLYLSENLNSCINEVGILDKNKKRYYSKFKNKGTSVYFNLTIPNNVSSLSEVDKFSFIITYPMLVLCLSRTLGDSKFEEEYLFPQLLLPSLFLTNNEDTLKHIGIAYNSTKDYNSINLVIPAKLNSNEIIPQNLVCDFISNNIDEFGPIELNKIEITCLLFYENGIKK